MQKLKMHSPNMTQANIAHIRTRFPHCVTEAHDANGNVVYKVDFDLLRQELAGELVEGPQERYRLDWPGKRQAMLTANTPVAKSLRPCREESVDFDTTENLYIEGDNLEVLKLLQESYLGKIKMIYIDPPYNTGNDFVYNDDFANDSSEFLQLDGQYGDSGDRMVQNLESNGRFHSDWLSMIYQRLRVARNLLIDEGVIFLSIDDNEFHNIRRVCDEVFGEKNFIGCLPRLTSAQRPAQEDFFSTTHDFIVVYAKNKNSNIEFNRIIERKNLDKVKSDKNGSYIDGDTSPILASSTQGYSLGGDYDFEYNGKKYTPIDSKGNRRRWLWTKQRMEAAAKLGILVETASTLRVRNYIDKEFEQNTNIMHDKDSHLTLASLDLMDALFVNNRGTSELEKLGLNSCFNFAKPITLLEALIRLATNKQARILDFFSGSGTTAHAVMQCNAEDGGKRKFIMVQLPEVCPPDTEAGKAGHKNICEIGKERIRRAGKKIKKEQPLTTQNLDIGFRVLKVQPSCMADVYYTPDKAKQSLLLYDNIKTEATPEDLLFQVLTDWGVELHLPIAVKTIKDKKAFFVDENSLVACFERDIDDDFIKEVAGYKPIRVVFCDSGFANDAARINAEQIFKQLSPDTEVRVL